MPSRTTKTYLLYYGTAEAYLERMNRGQLALEETGVHRGQLERDLDDDVTLRFDFGGFVYVLWAHPDGKTIRARVFRRRGDSNKAIADVRMDLGSARLQITTAVSGRDLQQIIDTLAPGGAARVIRQTTS